ncbi:MAG: hypothetical protein PHW96_02255 [Candidatus Nanoarchaeia archaeon]|nr:hypothetical protein [Candidatus Nanoarchaeia archaeon]
MNEKKREYLKENYHNAFVNAFYCLSSNFEKGIDAKKSLLYFIDYIETLEDFFKETRNVSEVSDVLESLKKLNKEGYSKEEYSKFEDFLGKFRGTEPIEELLGPDPKIPLYADKEQIMLVEEVGKNFHRVFNRTLIILDDYKKGKERTIEDEKRLEHVISFYIELRKTAVWDEHLFRGSEINELLEILSHVKNNKYNEEIFERSCKLMKSLSDYVDYNLRRYFG